MADPIDIANELVETELSRALNKLRQNTAQDQTGTKFCIECGDKMPVGRKKLGFKLCVPCAEEAERRKSLYID